MFDVNAIPFMIPIILLSFLFAVFLFVVSRKLFVVILMFAFFFISSSSVYAGVSEELTESEWIYPTDVECLGANVSNCTVEAITSNDNIYLTQDYSAWSSGMILTFQTDIIPEGSEFLYMQYERSGKSSSNSTDYSIYNKVNSYSGATFHFIDVYPTINDVKHTQQTWESTNQAYGQIPNEQIDSRILTSDLYIDALISGEFYVKDYQNKTGTITSYVDEWRMKVFYYAYVPETPSDISIDSEDIDVDQQELTISGSGDFNFTGEGYNARMVIYQTCTETTSGFVIDDPSPKVVIDWFASDSQDHTSTTDGFLYRGAGYTEEDSSYSFENVVLPYNYGYNCTYPTYIFIYDDENNLVWGSTEEEGIYEIIPSTSTENIIYQPPAVEEEYEGIFSGIINWFKSFVSKLFSTATLSANFSRDLTLLREYLGTKAPFAYFYAVFETDFTAPNVVDSIPDMVFPFDSGYEGYSDITVNFPDALDTIVNLVRAFINVALLFLFFGYILVVARRLNR